MEFCVPGITCICDFREWSAASEHEEYAKMVRAWDPTQWSCRGEFRDRRGQCIEELELEEVVFFLHGDSLLVP